MGLFNAYQLHKRVSNLEDALRNTSSNLSKYVNSPDGRQSVRLDYAIQLILEHLGLEIGEVDKKDCREYRDIGLKKRHKQ